MSISLLPAVYDALDQMVESRGFKNRSQAIAEMISQNVICQSQLLGEDVVAGTITLVYDESKPNLLEELSRIERKHINEVVSSQHVLLENYHTMEVLLVQGPASALNSIKDELVTCKGVKTGSLTITSSILPPIHSRR